MIIRHVAAVVAASGLLVADGVSQVREQVIVTSHDVGNSHPHVRRFDRRLALLGETDLVPQAQSSLDEILTEVGIGPDGTIWLPIDDLNQKKLVRMDRDGNLLPSIVLAHNPVCLAVSQSGTVYALTRIPLLTDGPMYSASGDGGVLWSNGAAPALYGTFLPANLAITVTGDVWVGGSTDAPCGGCIFDSEGLVVQIDLANGDVLRTISLVPVPIQQLTLASMAAAPNGTVWSAVGFGLPFYLMNTDSNGLLSTVPIASISNTDVYYIRVDAGGDIWAVGSIDESEGALIRRFSQSDGSILTELNVDDRVHGFALGPSGEEMFAVTISVTPPFYRLVRVNLVTERMSARSLDPWIFNGLGTGDPTGFVYANVVDQLGDNDNDGATNRAETLAGTSPYDPLSRPEGPKVYIDFTANNAIILIFKDPDGLLDPVGGLDVGSISLEAGVYGEIFPLLLSFLTFVQVSPDLTEATAVFGALPLGTDLKLPLDARVTDKTGAVGWDWQVSPPGEL
ncbi:MAG: NHL repeat-containing protein [Planctomycetota bacterium]